MTSDPTRVAVVGGGPAGATVACLLARKGASVVLFDDGRRPEMIVGESLVPQLVPIFQRLGIEESVKKLGIRKPGVTVTFEEGQEILLSFEAVRGVLPTYSYNVPRHGFDRLLADTATAAGVRQIFEIPRLEAFDTGNPKTACVRLGDETLAAIPEWKGQPPDMVIDASGRRRLFAKLLGIPAQIGPRKDVAHFAHYEHCPWPEPHGQVMTMRLEYGWGWRIPLPGPRLSIGVVVNKEHARRFGDTPEEQLEAIIDNDPRLARECGGRKRVTSVATYTNYQLTSEWGSGPGWALVGDAFGFVDPMLSPGLCMAMLSAEKLADAIPATGGCDRRTPAVLKTYWRWFATQLEAWQELVGYFYDGRIFATVKQGMHLMERYPGRPGEIIQRHIEKNLSGMASGAYTTRWYSRLLLRVLVRFSLGRFKPDDYAIR